MRQNQWFRTLLVVCVFSTALAPRAAAMCMGPADRDLSWTGLYPATESESVPLRAGARNGNASHRNPLEGRSAPLHGDKAFKNSVAHGLSTGRHGWRGSRRPSFAYRIPSGRTMRSRRTSSSQVPQPKPARRSRFEASTSSTRAGRARISSRRTFGYRAPQRRFASNGLRTNTGSVRERPPHSYFPRTMGRFFDPEDRSVPSEAVLELGHVNCFGNTLAWGDEKPLYVGITALYSDGSTQQLGGGPLELHPPKRPFAMKLMENYLIPLRYRVNHFLASW